MFKVKYHLEKDYFNFPYLYSLATCTLHMPSLQNTVNFPFSPLCHKVQTLEHQPTNDQSIFKKYLCENCTKLT